MPSDLYVVRGSHPDPQTTMLSKRIYSGAGAPSSGGVEGDIYINESNGDFYEYSGGVWVLRFSSGGGGGGAGLTYYQGAFLDPNGNQTGNVGDVYYSRMALGGDGSIWFKGSGNSTDQGWGD